LSQVFVGRARYAIGDDMVTRQVKHFCIPTYQLTNATESVYLKYAGMPGQQIDGPAVH